MDFGKCELERALRQLRRGADPRAVAEEMSRRLVNKLMHAPLSALGAGEAVAAAGIGPALEDR